MASNTVFDCAVIGSGPAGYVAAIRAAQLGMNTAIVEKDTTFGGTCLNVGCIPSKALLDSSERYHEAKDKLSSHGILSSGIQLDLSQMMKRKEGIVKQLVMGVDHLLKKNKVERFKGFGKIVSAQGDVKTVEVTGAGGESNTFQTKRILIATGSVPIELPFLKFNGSTIVSSTEALAFDSVPQHLVVVGGGVIGLELGSVWSRLGAKVTVIEFQNRIMGGMDAQVSAELQKALAKQGLEFLLAHKCLGADPNNSLGMTIKAENLANQQVVEVDCDRILVAVGRKPFTDGLGVQESGIALDNGGRIIIDDNFETNVKGVFAVGDVVDGPMLAHKGEEEGVAAVEIMAGQKAHVNYDAIPNVVYTWPELASVGYTEEELKDAGIQYKLGSFPFVHNGRAKAMDEKDGIVKVLADKATDRLLGVHIVGPRAGDLIAEAVAFMEFGASSEDIARTCHAHPTLSEIVKEAALGADNRQIHL